jgi:hypothetical protein
MLCHSCQPQTKEIMTMKNSLKMTAEEKFNASLKKEEQALSDRENATRKRVEKMARLKALRLGKSKPEPEA